MKWKLLILALLFSGVMIGQIKNDRQQNREEIKQNRQDRIENLKIAYISKELKLTTSESEKFWPVYNKYQVMLKDTRQLSKLRNNDSELDERKADEIIKVHIENEYKRAEIHEKMIADLKPIIGSVRVIELYKVEAKFIKEILNRTEQRNRKNLRGRK